MTHRIFTLLAVFSLAVPVVAADRRSDDEGKELLNKLFQPAAAAAANSTARLQLYGRDVVLGTVVSKDGLILTKGSELIGKDGKLADGVGCQFPVFGDGSVFDVTVKGYDPESDLMLLKADVERELPPVKFADPKKAEPGNWVAVPGPRTAGSDTLEPIAVGVISAGSRRLYLPESRIENGNRGYLGITFGNMAQDTDTSIGGVSNESAKKAGMKEGDFIIALNGKEVKNKGDIFDVLNLTHPGETMKVKVRRKGKDGDEVLTFEVKMIPLAGMDRGALQNSMGGKLSDRRGGFSKVIQHDAVLEPKQCGGPLVDLEGNVLGINIARAGRVETWVLPADVIETTLAELKAGKHPFPKNEVVSKDQSK